MDREWRTVSCRSWPKREREPDCSHLKPILAPKGVLERARGLHQGEPWGLKWALASCRRGVTQAWGPAQVPQDASETLRRGGVGPKYLPSEAMPVSSQVRRSSVPLSPWCCQVNKGGRGEERRKTRPHHLQEWTSLSFEWRLNQRIKSWTGYQIYDLIIYAYFVMA